jgi:hypothetical protein
MEGTISDIYLTAASRIFKHLASDSGAGDDICISESVAVNVLFPLLSKHNKIVEIMQPASKWFSKVD